MHSSSHTAQAPQFAPATVPANLNTAIGCFVLTLPILLWLSVIAHRKHRAVILQRQTEMLERLWLLNSTKTLP